ncbi:hypothetical protein BKA81DRAFT_366522 [Phyllosticta paracitricarpa]
MAFVLEVLHQFFCLLLPLCDSFHLVLFKSLAQVNKTSQFNVLGVIESLHGVHFHGTSVIVRACSD